MRKWQAACKVCREQWICESDNNPGATFCETCREWGLVAPGVLNWKECPIVKGSR
jgi:hypothetical protein